MVTEAAQQEYDKIIMAFYTVYDYGYPLANIVERDIVDGMDSDEHKEAFKMFFAGYKHARRKFTGKDIAD